MLPGFKLMAIVLYGDPRHMPNQTYNVGDVAASSVSVRITYFQLTMTDWKLV